MLCSNCGINLANHANFCGKCGTSVERAVNNAVPLEDKPISKIKSTNKRFFIIAAIITVVISLIAITAVLNMNREADSPAHLLSLGERFLLDMEYEKALVQFLAVIEIEPNNVRAYLGAAEALIALGRIDEAIDILQLGYERTGSFAIAALLDSLVTEEPLPHPYLLEDTALITNLVERLVRSFSMDTIRTSAMNNADMIWFLLTAPEIMALEIVPYDIFDRFAYEIFGRDDFFSQYVEHSPVVAETGVIMMHEDGFTVYPWGETDLYFSGEIRQITTSPDNTATVLLSLYSSTLNLETWTREVDNHGPYQIILAQLWEGDESFIRFIGLERIVSPMLDAALSAYNRFLVDYIAEHGSISPNFETPWGSWEAWDNTNQLLFADLIDFDGDGVPELFIAFRDSQAEETRNFFFSVYGYDSGLRHLVTESMDASHGDWDVGVQILSQWDGRNFIGRIYNGGSAQTGREYSTLRESRWSVELTTFRTFWDDTFEVNGIEVNEWAYETAVERNIGTFIGRRDINRANFNDLSIQTALRTVRAERTVAPAVPSQEAPTQDTQSETAPHQQPEPIAPTPQPTMESPEIGGTIQFGDYSWRVLDLQDGYALIITENIIFERGFHRYWDVVTWETSEIRQYLNDTFFNSFGEADRSRIRESSLINENNQWLGTNGGGNTIDRIFLLSLYEVVRYFGDSGLLHNRPSPNEWRIDDEFNHVRIAGTEADSLPMWWLRTPGDDASEAVIVNSDGTISIVGTGMRGGVVNRFGIRPALWLSVER